MRCFIGGVEGLTVEEGIEHGGLLGSGFEVLEDEYLGSYLTGLDFVGRTVSA